MTKKQNTLVFIIAATIFNILLTLVLLLLLTIGALLIFKEKISVILPFLFIFAIILGFILYQKITKIVIKKFNLEEKLDPIFTSRKKNKN